MLRENRNHWLDHPALSLQWCMCSGRPENAVWAHKGHNRRRCQLVPQRLHQEPKCRIPSTAGITIHYRRVLTFFSRHPLHLHHCRDNRGWSVWWILLSQSIFTPARTAFHMFFQAKRQFKLRSCWPITKEKLLGGFWTLPAQCCWRGVAFCKKALQHSGSPTVCHFHSSKYPFCS